MIPLVFLAFALGMVAGIGWRYVQVQRALQIDLEALIAELYTYIDIEDRTAFMMLIDPADATWRAYQAAWFDEMQRHRPRPMRPGKIVEARLRGERAWARVTMYGRSGPVVARLDFISRQGEWFLARPDPVDWGDRTRLDAPHLAIRCRARDVPVVRQALSALDAFTEEVCRLLGDSKCHVVLQLSPDPRELGPPSGVARMRLYEPGFAPPTLFQLGLPDGASIYVLSPVPLNLAQEAIRERLQARYPADEDASWPQQGLLQQRETWPRAVRTFDLEDGDPLIRLPSPTWVGVADQGGPSEAWMTLARRHIAEAMVRQRLGPLMGTHSYVNGAWALAIGVAEWLAVPQSFPDISLPWSPLEDIGRRIRAGQADLGRRQARDAATYIATRWGPGALARLLDALAAETNLDDALSQSLTLDQQAFQAGWRAYRRVSR